MHSEIIDGAAQGVFTKACSRENEEDESVSEFDVVYLEICSLKSPQHVHSTHPLPPLALTVFTCSEILLQQISYETE